MPFIRIAILLGSLLALYLNGVQPANYAAPPEPRKEDKGDQETKKSENAFSSRSAAMRTQMLRVYGGNEETEKAVALGLKWLAKQQKKDGSWKFDGSKEDETIAASGMALLPFLAAGETHKSDSKYSEVVKKGLEYLRDQIGKDGHFKNAGNYTQAVATIALCEAAGMTKDAKYLELAQKACDVIIDNQADDGSWGYEDKSPGDSCILGFQIQALYAGRCAGLKIPDDTFKNAEKFLKSVSSESGSQYGYKKSGTDNERLTAAAHLSRQTMGNWGRKEKGLAIGVKWMWENHKPTADDLYYTYYATQVFRYYGGASWHRDWNPAMQKALLPKQITEKTKDAHEKDIGSWNADKGIFGASCGRLGTTAFVVLTLEVYYRYEPINTKDGVKR